MRRVARNEATSERLTTSAASVAQLKLLNHTSRACGYTRAFYMHHMIPSIHVRGLLADQRCYNRDGIIFIFSSAWSKYCPKVK